MRKLALQGLSTDNVSRPLPEFPQERTQAPTLSTERSKGQMSPVSKYSDVPVEIKQTLRKENVRNLGRLVERAGGPNTPKGRAPAAVLEERGVNPFLAGSNPQMAKMMPYNIVKQGEYARAVGKLEKLSLALPTGMMQSPDPNQSQKPAAPYAPNAVARGAVGGVAGGAIGLAGGAVAGTMAGGLPGAVVGGALGAGVGAMTGGAGGQFGKSAALPLGVTLPLAQARMRVTQAVSRLPGAQQVKSAVTNPNSLLSRAAVKVQTNPLIADNADNIMDLLGKFASRQRDAMYKKEAALGQAARASAQ